MDRKYSITSQTKASSNIYNIFIGIYCSKNTKSLKVSFICINLLLRGLTVYWLYWLNLRQYTLNLYSTGELCRFSINKSAEDFAQLCVLASVLIGLVLGNDEAGDPYEQIIQLLSIPWSKSKFWKFRFYIEWILQRTVFAIQLFKSITLSEIFQIFFSQYFILC